MLKIINITQRTIEINKDIKIKPNNYIFMSGTINSRLQQLYNMGLIVIKTVSDESNIIKKSIEKSKSEIIREKTMQKIMSEDKLPELPPMQTKIISLIKNENKGKRKK